VLAALGPALLCTAVLHLTAIAVLAARPAARPAQVGAALAAGAAVGLAAVVTLLPARPLVPAAVAVSAVVLTAAAYAARRPALHPAGAALWITWLAFGAAASTWSVLFLTGLSLSLPTLALLWTAAAIAVVTLPSAVVTAREGWEPLLRRTWSRSRTAAPLPSGRLPRVSVHVPCHAEPPEVVIATLDRLAALDYADFEVLVIDNNTSDPDLWRPVQRHCAVLGRRFRFLHVEGLTGAKAGALNWALPHADPSAELVAVVDADYHVEPQWLREVVGHFGDPAMGFVQAPHAYRDVERSRFARWAAAEYAVFFATGMVALDEHRAGLTVGTMSVIRRRALEDAGGWAQWCLTEDSELAIRIHAAGYESVYLPHAYGRGLIPETFAAYRKQRFRWTYGPVQEVQRHWRLFLPTWLGGRESALTSGQKLHHANHGIDVMCIGLRLVALVVGAAAAASMLVQAEAVQVPLELWLAATVLLLGSVAVRFLVYLRVVGLSLRRAVGGTFAFAALALVIGVASLRATTRRPATWQRTAKFRVGHSGAAALGQARTEAVLGATGGLAGATLLITGAGGIAGMLAIGLLVQAATWSTAPLLALVADRSLRRRPVQAGEPLRTATAA